jgi:transcriptional regulator with XRE-family HTH domain
VNTPGERVALAMKRKGFSQRKLAELLKISQVSVSDITRDKWPARERMPEIAGHLGVPHEWLTVGDNPPSWAQPFGPRRITGKLTGTDTPAGELTTTDRRGPGLSVVGIAAAGDGDQANAWRAMREPEPLPIPDSWEAVHVRGDSAYPVAFDGQFVLIDCARAVTARDLCDADATDLHDNLVLVQTMENCAEKAYIKRFCREPRAPAGYVFASINAGRSSPYLAPECIEFIIPVVGVVFEDPRFPRKKGRSKPQHQEDSR